MRDPFADPYLRARRNGVPADFAGANGFAPDSPCRRVKTHRFINHELRVAQREEVGGNGCASGKNGIEPAMKFVFDLGMLCEQIPGPGERERGGFVTSEK